MNLDDLPALPIDSSAASTSSPDPTSTSTDDELTITIDTSAYYRWLPVKEDEVAEGDVVVDSTYPGFKMRRTIITEPDHLTTTVHLPSLRGINDDREVAGLARKPHYANLIQHLEDGPWYKMFPPGSIVGIHVDGDDEMHGKVAEHFLNEAVRNEQVSESPATSTSTVTATELPATTTELPTT